MMMMNMALPTFLVALSLASSSASSSSNATTTLQVCIDDTDCSREDTRCFEYLCYPWQDDSAVPESERRTICRRDRDCQSSLQQSCVRHHDRRKVHRGICLPRQDFLCKGPQDCPGGDGSGGSSGSSGCCNGRCCEGSYYEQYRRLPCISHQACRDLGLGEYCCAASEEQRRVCCDGDEEGDRVPHAPADRTPPSPSGAPDPPGAAAASPLFLLGFLL